MKYVADGYRDAASDLWEPHQETGYQKHQAAENDFPELKLLPAVVESDIFGLNLILVPDVSADFSQPLAVCVGPGHHAAPIEELEKPYDGESDSKPRVQEPGHRTTAKQRREPAKRPRRVDGQTRQQRREEKDRHRPVKKASISRMPQQLAFVDDSPAKPAEITLHYLIVRFSGCGHTTSSSLD